jgi:hypothetical protein
MPKETKPKIEITIDQARAAYAAPTVMKQVFGGCARIYVEFSGTLSAKAKENLRAAGFKVTLRPRYKGENRIYIGYDNATCSEYSRGDSVAAFFNGIGISCSVDGDGD